LIQSVETVSSNLTCRHEIGQNPTVRSRSKFHPQPRLYLTRLAHLQASHEMKLVDVIYVMSHLPSPLQISSIARIFNVIVDNLTFRIALQIIKNACRSHSSLNRRFILIPGTADRSLSLSRIRYQRLRTWFSNTSTLPRVFPRSQLPFAAHAAQVTPRRGRLSKQQQVAPGSF
jgi:hypothetical protein